jgi:hypothetical protein
MNSYFTYQLSYDRTDAFLADAAAARQRDDARRARRNAARRPAAPAASGPRTARHMVVAHAIARPFALAHSWLAAGQL